MARTSRYIDNTLAIETNLKQWKVALYIRLSREDGDKEESESIITQKAMLTRYIADKEIKCNNVCLILL